MFDLEKMNSDHWHLLHALDDDGTEISIRLANFSNAVRQHFAEEERFMQDEMYPGFINHLRAHAQLLHDINNILFNYPSENYYEIMVKSLYDLLITHVDHYDKMLEQFIVERGS